MSKAHCYKEEIINLQSTLNEYPREKREEVHQFLLNNGCKSMENSSDGVYVTLDYMDDNLLKRLYHFICYVIEVKPIEI